MVWGHCYIFSLGLKFRPANPFPLTISPFSANIVFSLNREAALKSSQDSKVVNFQNQFKFNLKVKLQAVEWALAIVLLLRHIAIA